MRGGMVVRMPFPDGNGWIQVCRQGFFLRHWMSVVYRDGKYHLLYGGPARDVGVFEGMPIMYLLEFDEIGGGIHADVLLFGDVRPRSDMVIGRGEAYIDGVEYRVAYPPFGASQGRPQVVRAR